MLHEHSRNMYAENLLAGYWEVELRIAANEVFIYI